MHSLVHQGRPQVPSSIRPQARGSLQRGEFLLWTNPLALRWQCQPMGCTTCTFEFSHLSLSGYTYANTHPARLRLADIHVSEMTQKMCFASVLVGWHFSGGGIILLAAPNPIAVRPTFPKMFGRSPDESDHCRKCSDCHSYSENGRMCIV